METIILNVPKIYVHSIKKLIKLIKKNNHCLRINNCYYNVFGTMRQTSKNKNCKCDGKYSYKCEDYCTINNKYTVI
jgi:hypothetical protein